MKTLACPECHSDIFYMEDSSAHRGNQTDTYCCANGHVCTLSYKMVKTVSPDVAHKAPVVALDASDLSLLGDRPMH